MQPKNQEGIVMQDMEASVDEQTLQSSEFSKVIHNHILRLNITFLAVSFIGAIVMLVIKTH